MWFHNPVWVCVYTRGCICVSMSDCARMRVDARLSPAEEAQCVSVEVEGERRVSFYKSGQIRGTET